MQKRKKLYNFFYIHKETKYSKKNYSEINRRKLYKKLLGRCPLGLPTLGFANTGPEGLEGSTGSAPKLGPEACFSEELDSSGAPHLINRCGSLSASEVGLNSHHHTAVQGLWSRLVAPTGTKGGHWYRFVAPTGTKGWNWSRFVPPTGTNGLAQRRGGSLIPPC